MLSKGKRVMANSHWLGTSGQRQGKQLHGECNCSSNAGAVSSETAHRLIIAVVVILFILVALLLVVVVLKPYR